MMYATSTHVTTSGTDGEGMMLFDLADAITSLRDGYNDTVGRLDRAHDAAEDMVATVLAVRSYLAANPAHDGSTTAADECQRAHAALIGAAEAAGAAIVALAAAHDALAKVRW